ncbi:MULTISPECIES: hypothetical protein [Pseudomonas]|jgi:hypothetical protein|uniref:Uncharacterized protein n=1 Tax=Pseudomonas fluorescens TaxID=294 RepID=A0A5E7H260_PSEFL|nr:MULTISPECIES: hypothetical protein [Pseudomonas]VVM59355.1 hypothetical protein PS647_01219 [Pseudomonas fluorescens]VVM64761.1 hypothetical protein PS673_01462 [Pseudomonas fluorescens]VVO58044.1 hypothetical protein PS843_00631 [Pseudomonas fluorescens]
MDALPFSFHSIAHQLSGCQQRTGTHQSRLEPNCEIKETMQKGNPALNTSAICLLSSLLVSVAASATGVNPVFDLDFTRSATETLKKLHINDACIIAISSPAAFTFCREGSSTLWKYQALDLEQQALIQIGQKRSSTDFQQITLVEVDSVACEQDHLVEWVKPTIRHGLVLGLITLFLLAGLRYTYRAIMHCCYDEAGFSKFGLQRLDESWSTHNSTVMALVAWGMAAAMAFVYFGF